MSFWFCPCEEQIDSLLSFSFFLSNILLLILWCILWPWRFTYEFLNSQSNGLLLGLLLAKENPWSLTEEQEERNRIFICIYFYVGKNKKEIKVYYYTV